MTEHSKIPLPSKGPKGKSLFERVEGALGLDGFRVAPVPDELAPPANRRPAKRPPQPPVADAAPVHLPVADLADSAPVASSPAAPEPVTEERVEFSSDKQAIDRARLQRQGLIVPDGPVSSLLEEFRILKRQVLLAVREARAAGRGAVAQRVLVCSPLPGEGKTFCAVNLALAMAAERDSEVVLVDADFAKPSIPALLGLSAGKGLMDALSDPQVNVEDCVIATDVAGLYVLPAGTATASDSEYLATARTSDVLDRLTRGASNRTVIFDSPPALAASPAAELANHVGQALVICRADRTGQSALEDALSLLSACPDLKLVLNSAHFSPSGRRFGAYYHGGAA
jgi:Mrp family chromosome partitioning ATPase